MNEIEKLIQELCPDGVEYRRLLSVSDVLYGFPCDASKFNDNQLGSPLARIRDVLDGYTKTYTTEQVPEKYILRKNDLLIGMDGNFHVANWKMDGGILCQRVCKIYSNDNEQSVLNGYLSHLLKPLIKRIEESKPNGTVKHLLDRDLKELEIPLPPITIQEKIVEILDKFTSLEAELEAELEARRKQYEYYREKLLDLEGKEGVEMKTLLEVLQQPITDGPHETPRFFDEGVPFISAEAVVNNSIDFSRKRGFISTEYDNLCRKKYSPQINDIFLVKSGSTTGKVAIVKTTERFNIWSPLAAIRVNKENSPFFVYYLLQTKRIQDQVRMKSSNGSQPNLSMRVLEKFTIPVPPLSEQRRIVAILDRFEALTNDLQAGLPAEIAARRQQYEYYREKLLTFKRKTV